MHYKIVRIFVNNSSDKFGVWPEGKPSFGSPPIKIFKYEKAAKNFIKRQKA